MKISISQTPKTNRKQKCRTCGVTFMGFPNSQYCSKHQGSVDYKDKKNEQKKLEEETFENEWVKSPVKVTEKLTINRECDCCGKLYDYVIYPDTEHLPRFCLDHRNEYRRTWYNQCHKEKK